MKSGYKHIFLIDPISLIDFNYISKKKIKTIKHHIEKSIKTASDMTSELISKYLNKFSEDFLSSYDNDNDFEEFMDTLSGFWDELKVKLYELSVNNSKKENIGEQCTFYMDEPTIICNDYDKLIIYRYNKIADSEGELYLSDHIKSEMKEILSQVSMCNIYILHINVWLPKIPINTYYISEGGIK